MPKMSFAPSVRGSHLAPTPRERIVADEQNRPPQGAADMVLVALAVTSLASGGFFAGLVVPDLCSLDQHRVAVRGELVDGLREPGHADERGAELLADGVWPLRASSPLDRHVLVEGVGVEVRLDVAEVEAADLLEEGADDGVDARDAQVRGAKGT